MKALRLNPAALAAACLLLSLSFFFLIGWSPSLRSTRTAHHATTLDSIKHIVAPGPEFRWERDGEDYSLSSSQCHAAFAPLFAEIDRAASQWHDGRLTEPSLQLIRQNAAGVRILLHNNKIRIISTWNSAHQFWGFRVFAALEQIHRAVNHGAADHIPDTEFVITADDWGKLPDANHTAFAISRNVRDPVQDNLWLIPDFHFWRSQRSESGFSHWQARARQFDGPLLDKVPRLFWRGVVDTSPDLRKRLLDATAGQAWADVEEMSWASKSTVVQRDEFCKYRFLAYTEGVAYSSRMTFLLNCDSVPVIHDDMHFAAHYFHLLEPGVNYVPVWRNFSNLPDQISRYLVDDDAAQAIADGARSTFRERYTTPAATACYWRRLLSTYAAVAFKPNLYADADKKELRGISLEDFRRDYDGNDYMPELIGPAPTEDARGED